MEELKAVLQIKLESLCVEGGTPSKGLTAPKKDPRSRSSSTISLKSCTGAGSNESDGGTSVENKADDPALNVTYEVETSGESIGDDAKNDELLETYMKRKLGQIEGNSRIPKLFVKVSACFLGYNFHTCTAKLKNNNWKRICCRITK